MLKRKIVDWAGEWGQAAPLMCGDQLLLVHENKTPLISWDPFPHTKGQALHAGQGAWNSFGSRILPWYKAYGSVDKKLCHSTSLLPPSPPLGHKSEFGCNGPIQEAMEGAPKKLSPLQLNQENQEPSLWVYYQVTGNDDLLLALIKSMETGPSVVESGRGF